MISSIMLLISLIKEANTFREFIEAVKDPENKDVNKAFILLAVTIVLLIMLIYYLNLFATVNTPGMRRTMKESPETIVGNWWCPNVPFIWGMRSGTTIIIRSIDQKSFENPAFNHYSVIQDVDGYTYKTLYRASVKVSFDEEGNMEFTRLDATFDEGENLKYKGDSSHYRFAHFLKYLVLYDYDNDDKFYCISMPGHLPESIYHYRYVE